MHVHRIGSLILLLSALSWGQIFQAVPLNDLGTGTYLGFQGGLYENGTNVIPSDHLADGNALNSQIADGTPFVFLGIGMSDEKNGFRSLITQAEATSGLNRSMAIIDGGQGDENSCEWAYPQGTPAENHCPHSSGAQLANPYDNVITTLAPPKCGNPGHQPCFTEADVRVVLYYDANSCRLIGNCTGLPSSSADAYSQEAYEGMMARAVHVRYPNTRKLFLVSQEYGGYSNVNIHPEPYAYESGFSAKWTIQAQINQVRGGKPDPIAGDLSYSSAPWIAWGLYTWASGPTPRLDGLVWCLGQTKAPCNKEIDFQTDGTHLSKSAGVQKWGDLELSFFMTEPWFLASVE
jgi:hypothetical protein